MRGIIWDLDGTLIDSQEAHFRAWSAITRAYDIPFNREIFLATFGQNNNLLLREWLGARWTSELAAEIANRKEQTYRREAQGRIKVYAGAVRWLEAMRRAGWRQALGTSAPWANVDAILDALDWRDYFDAISSGENLPSKPDPIVFLNAAHEMDIDPARCVVVEDAPAGVEGAQRAGMRAVALTTTKPAEAFNGADVVAPSLEALPPDTFERLMPV